jgi:uncharacterized protein (TIGR00251 family)
MSSTRLNIKVVPGASSDRIVGWLGESLKVCVRVPPEKGKANKAVETVIIQALGLPKKSVRIISGHTSARKVIEVEGLSETELRERLAD